MGELNNLKDQTNESPSTIARTSYVGDELLNSFANTLKIHGLQGSIANYLVKLNHWPYLGSTNSTETLTMAMV